MTTNILYKGGDVKRLIKTGLFIISLAVYIISSHTHANSVEFDDNILAGFPGITGNISHAHFNYGGNDFYGTFFRLTPVDTGNTTISQVGSSDKICKKQLRGLYYNNERGYRLRPLDNETLSTLKGIDSTYNNLVLSGGLYTLCSGSNADEVYGQIIHNRYNGTTFYLTVGINQDFTNNIYTGGRSGNFKFLNNTTGYFRDNRGGIANIWGTGVPTITQTGACNGVVTNGVYYNGTTSYSITQTRNGSSRNPTTSGQWAGLPTSGSCNFKCITGYARSGVVSQCLTTSDITAPIIAEVTPVATPTNDNTPNYTFSSTEAGTITYGGSCSSSTTNANIGNNTITFATLADGIHNDCTIIVTDSANNQSNILTITAFTIDATKPTCDFTYNPSADTSGNVIATCTPNETVTFQSPSGTGIYTFTGNGSFIFNFTDTFGNTGTATATVNWIDKIAPIIAEVTPVPTPTNDNTPNYTFSSTETGKITYGGSCASSTINANIGNNTITLNTLANGTYSNCTITVTDSVGNQSNILTITAFTVNTTIPDTTAPTCILSYNPSTATSGNVIATCTPNETVTFQSPSGTGIYTFTGNGSFIFNFTDTAGNTGTTTATVNWIDKIAPILVEVTPVPTPTNDNTPNYTFSSTEAGTAIYGGSCSGTNSNINQNVNIGNNTITLNTLANGTYSNCTITVTDSVGNQSNILTITAFTVNTTIPDTTAPTCILSYNPSTATSGNVIATCTPNETVTFQSPSGTGIYTFTGNGSFIFNFTDTAGNTGTTTATVNWIDKIAPVLTQVTSITTPTTDTTPDYTFSSTKAGTITYGGSCSSTTTNANIGNNTITLNTLANGTYSNCTITVTDNVGNQSNILLMSAFTINFTTCRSGRTNQSGTCILTATGNTIITGTISSGTIFTIPGNIIIYSSGSNTGGYLQISGVSSIGISYNNRNGILIAPTILTAGSCAISTNTLMSISSGLINPVVLLEFQAGASGSTLTSNTTGGYFTIKVKLNNGIIGNTYRIFRSTQCAAGREKVYIDETCILDSNKMCEFRTNKLSYFNIVANNTFSGGIGTPMIVGTIPRLRNAQIDKAYTSDPFTIANFNDVTFATVSKGMLYVNGEPIGTGGYVKNGDELNIELYSSKKYDTTLSSKITVGSVSATFYITTLLEGDDNSSDLSNLQKIRIMSIFNLLIDLYSDDPSKEEEFLYTLRSMLIDKLDSIDEDDDAYSTFEYLLSLIEARLLTSGIDESNHIAPTCKEYEIAFEKDEDAYYSPDFKKAQYFATRESLIRYIDSKNPGDCRLNTYGSNEIDTTNTDSDKHIAPNGKVYKVESNNGGYTSPDLSNTKYFDTLQGLRAYLNINNPAITIRNHEIDTSFEALNYIAPNGKVYKIYQTNKGYMSYKLIKIRYFTTLESIKGFINQNNKI